ncbi:MAG: signal peptide peptidase SppA [Candidatus Kuenenbacteria bacterium]
MQPQTENELTPKAKDNIVSKFFPTFKKILSKRFNFKKLVKKFAIVIVILAALIIVKDEVEYQFGLGVWSEDAGYQDEYAEEDTLSDVNCNISGISLHGDLWTYISPADYDTDGNLLYDESSSEDIVYYIEEAEKDDNIKAIVLEIDSYGGSPVADEEVANALKMATKPTVALIRGAGLSAAYYAATGADIIFASQDSDVGSIGVTYSYLDYVKQNQNEGLTFNQISSGKYKDLMNPDKSLTGEERALLMRDVEIMNENFIRVVAENRNLDIEEVRKLADGSSMLGTMALENGLIDRIGGQSEVEDYLRDLIGEDVEICW